MGYTPPWLDVRKVGTTTSVRPIAATTEAFKIYANSIDATPFITLTGLADVKYDMASGKALFIRCNGADVCYIYGDATDSYYEAITNNNIFLKTGGTGKVKFGTFTGSGDVATNGYIDIIDAAGNARKLMVRA
jgi:hypothetical protein